MKSTNPLAYEYHWLRDDDHMFSMLTKDYEFRCSNYAVAYMFRQLLDKLNLCDHSNIYDDCFIYGDWIIFFTCRPQDAIRMKYVAKRIKSSIPANVRIVDENEEEI